MKTLLIGASAAALAGCTCPAPLNLNQVGPPPVAFQADVRETETPAVAKIHKSPSAPSGKNTNPAARTATHTPATKKEPSPPVQLDEKPDPVIEKAKAAIRTVMEDPASAEFGEIRRVVKILLGEPINTICGHVIGKNASGGTTGEMAFLYIVQDDEAYLVDGNNPMAETGYRNLCE